MTKKYKTIKITKIIKIINGFMYYCPSRMDLILIHFADELPNSIDSYLKKIGFNPKKFKGVPADLATSYCFDMGGGFPKSHFVPELRDLARTHSLKLEVVANDLYKEIQGSIIYKSQKA